MRIVVLVMMALALAAGTVQAEPKTRTITLKDGSTIQGKITGIDQGAYVVESPTLGQVKVSEDNVVSVLAPGEQAALTAPGASSGLVLSSDQMQNAQAQITSNPQAMADIQALASDPEVVQLISDPAFMQAVQSRDMSAIQANPRTAALMSNPKVKALIEKLQADRGTGN